MLAAYIQKPARAITSLPLTRPFERTSSFGLQAKGTLTTNANTRPWKTSGSSFGRQRRERGDDDVWEDRTGVEGRSTTSGQRFNFRNQGQASRPFRSTGSNGDFSKRTGSFSKPQDGRPMRGAYSHPGKQFAKQNRRGGDRSNPRSYDTAPSRKGSHLSVVSVHNLPDGVMYHEVATLLSQFGPIRSGHLLYQDGQFLNSAKITYFFPDHAMIAATHEQPLLLGGRQLQCARDNNPRAFAEQRRERVPSSSLLVHNVPIDMSLDAVRGVFSEVAEVSNVKIADTLTQLRSLTVEFMTAEGARKVLSRHSDDPFNLGEGDLAIKWASTTNGADANQLLSFSRTMNSPFLRVSHLPKHTTRDTVRHLFDQYVEVKDVTMDYYPDGKPTSTCYVKFNSVRDAESILDADRKHPFKIKEYKLRIAQAADPTLLEAPPHHTLIVSGFQGNHKVLKLYFEPYMLYIKDIHLLNTSHSLSTPWLVHTGWSTGFVKFDNIEHATLAKEQLSRAEVDHGVRLRIQYAAQPKPPSELGGQFGNDQGDEEYAYGVKGSLAQRERLDAVDEQAETGRGRFSFKAVDWQDRSTRIR